MQNLQLDQNSTVGSWVVDRPSRSRIFEALEIDYCCGGKRPLAEVCREKGLETEKVIESLQHEGTRGGLHDWNQATLTELCDHIEATHHAFLRTEMPRLLGLTRKIADVHGPNHPELAEVADTFASIVEELGSHMAKEEQVLFPMIRQLEHASSRPAFHCGSLANPIRVMEYEHDSAGGGLARLRQLTRDYACPDDACNTWRATCDGLHQFEKDLHQHIHKENNILFPRAIEMEQKMN